MVGISRSVYRYRPHTDKDILIIEAIRAVGRGECASSVWRQEGVQGLASARGYRWNHKRIYRVFCLLTRNTRRRDKRRLANRHIQTTSRTPGCVSGC